MSEMPRSAPSTGDLGELGSDPASDYTARVHAMYSLYAPEKLPTVEATMLRFRGNEKVLIQAMEMKYGPEPNSSGARGSPTGSRSSNMTVPADVMRADSFVGFLGDRSPSSPSNRQNGQGAAGSSLVHTDQGTSSPQPLTIESLLQRNRELEGQNATLRAEVGSLRTEVRNLEAMQTLWEDYEVEANHWREKHDQLLAQQMAANRGSRSPDRGSPINGKTPGMAPVPMIPLAKCQNYNAEDEEMSFVPLSARGTNGKTYKVAPTSARKSRSATATNTKESVLEDDERMGLYELLGVATDRLEHLQRSSTHQQERFTQHKALQTRMNQWYQFTVRSQRRKAKEAVLSRRYQQALGPSSQSSESKDPTQSNKNPTDQVVEGAREHLYRSQQRTVQLLLSATVRGTRCAVFARWRVFARENKKSTANPNPEGDLTTLLQSTLSALESSKRTTNAK